MATGTTVTDLNISQSGNLIIPLKKLPRYSINVTLENNIYILTVHWNVIDLAWYMDIYGVSNSEDITGIKLVTGPNLIKQYAMLELGAFYIIDVTGHEADPDFDNINITHLLMYVPTTNASDII